jgi:hypothetical protein
MYESTSPQGTFNGLNGSEFLMNSVIMLYGGYATVGHAIMKFFPQQPVPLELRNNAIKIEPLD